jgi:hypothetical protein
MASALGPVHRLPTQSRPFMFRQSSMKITVVSSWLRKPSECHGVQDSKVSNDAVATTAAIILFWPAAFLVKGDGQTAAALGRMKGEFETVVKVSIEKKCRYQFRAMEPPAAKRKRAAT